MPRNVTVTFADGSRHTYQGVPDNATPDQVEARASREFGRKVSNLDGGVAPAGQHGGLRSDGAPLLPGEAGFDATPSKDKSLADQAGAYFGRVGAALKDMSGMSPTDIARGSLGSLVTMARGAASIPIGSVAGIVGGFGKSQQEQGDIAQSVADKVAGTPRANTARVLGLIGAVAQPVTDLSEQTGADVALTPLAAEFQALSIPSARQLAPEKKFVAPPKTAEDVLARMQPQDSVGAAASAPGVGNLSPELKEAVVSTARKTGGAVNRQALDRHIDADSLPVPVRLTEGQATQDPTIISNEMNLRGKHPEIAKHLDQQNKALIENIQALRDQAGPDVFTTNAAEHGDTLIAAYKAKDEAAREAISAKYKALADANGGSLPVDGGAFVSAAAQGLKQQMKAPFLPAPIRQILVGIRKGDQMTIESFENLRTALAAEARKADRANDGNAEAAISIVRDALESVPFTGTSAKVKALADDARAAAKARFDELRADPAYKAVVNDKITPDQFVSKFVIRGSRDNVAKLVQAMAGNEQAEQTIRVAVLDHLRDQARVSSGNFAAASYNKALRNLDPKIRYLLPSDTADNAERLGRVAHLVTAQPRGSSVNNSNTLVAALAEHAAGAAEGATNVAFGGIPIGTWGRKYAKHKSDARVIKNALAQGAGLGNLESR